MARRRRKTWVALMIERQGVRRARTCMQFAMEWAVVARALGHVPTIDEYAVWWGMGRSTAYLHQTLWRQTLPEFPTPTEFFVAVGVDLVGSTPVDLSALALQPAVIA